LARNVLDELRLSGVAVVLFLVCLVVSGLPGSIGEPLLEYRENGQTVTVRTRDGCLLYSKDTTSRGPDETLTYCPARIPAGANGWAPQLRDFYAVDASNRTVTEVAQFGVVPDGVTRVRSTLPGGQTVEATTRRVGDIRHPVVLLHLRRVAIPVDLAETDGRRVFVRLEMFDGTGARVPVV
jgi:hypothetical protein